MYPDYFCCFKCHMGLKEPHRIAKSIRHTPVLFCVLCNDYCCSYNGQIIHFLVFFQLHPSGRVILKERKVPAKQRVQREENERIQARKKRIKKEIEKRKEKKKEALIN